MAVRPVKLLAGATVCVALSAAVLGGCSGGSTSSSTTLLPDISGLLSTTTAPAPGGSVNGLVTALARAGVTLCRFPSGLPTAASTAVGYAIDPNPTCHVEPEIHANLFVFGFPTQLDTYGYLGAFKRLESTTVASGTTTTTLTTPVAGWIFGNDALVISGPVAPATEATAARVFTSHGAQQIFSLLPS